MIDTDNIPTEIDLQRKARKLYSEHKKVIDFIMDNKDKTAFESAIKKYIKNHEDMFAHTHIESSLFIFVPKEWAKKIKDSTEFEWKHNGKYWGHNYPTMCFIELLDSDNSYKLKSQTEFIGSDKDFNTGLKDIGKFITDLSTEDFFIKQEKYEEYEKKEWIILQIANQPITIDVLNEEEMYEEIDMWFKNYKKNVIDKITEELPKWIKE